MSHAANLKLRHPHANLPSKRQRQSLEATTNHTSSPKANGVHIPFVNGESKISAVPTRDAKRRKREHDDDDKVPALVAGTDAGLSTPVSQDVVEISSGIEDEEDDDSDDSSVEEIQDQPEQKASTSSKPEQVNGIEPARSSKKDVNSIAPAQTDELQEGEMSFGDLLVAKHGQDPVSVDVAEAEAKSNRDALAAYQPRGALTAPNAASLGTVLTQALKTNDVELLESCLRVGNLDSIRATIERLHSSLAASLLSKLAERMHKRPGRAGSLMVWVQWTVVAHGGYLATQPAAMQQLRTLYQVVKQRASGLQPLLALKGKLDMLEAQMQLRRRMQERSRELHGEEAEPYIYVEGEESEDDAGDTSQRRQIATKADDSDEDQDSEEDDDEEDSEDEENEIDEDDDEDIGELDEEGAVDDLDEDEDEEDSGIKNNVLSPDLGRTNPMDGINESADEDEEEDDEEEDEDDDLIDDEVEETDDDLSSENEDDGDEYLEGEEVDSPSSEEEPQPPPKRSKSRK